MMSSTETPSRNKGYKKGYLTVDWSIRYAFDNGVTLTGGVNNIFNEKYYLSQDDGYTEKGKVVGAYIPAPERNYYIGFKYEI